MASSPPARPQAEDPLVAAWQKNEPWIRGRVLLNPHAAFFSPDAYVDQRTKGVMTALNYLRDGTLVSGLERRREGQVLVLADATGKEVSVPAGQIEQRIEYAWRPAGRRLVSFGPNLITRALWDHAGQLQDWLVSPDFSLELTGQTFVEFDHRQEMERFEGIPFRKRSTQVGLRSEWLPSLSFTSDESSYKLSLTLKPEEITRIHSRDRFGKDDREINARRSGRIGVSAQAGGHGGKGLVDLVGFAGIESPVACTRSAERGAGGAERDGFEPPPALQRNGDAEVLLAGGIDIADARRGKRQARLDIADAERRQALQLRKKLGRGPVGGERRVDDQRGHAARRGDGRGEAFRHEVREGFDLVLGDRVLRLRDPRRFGAVLWVTGDADAHPLLAHLGIEPLSRSLDAKRLYALTRAHRTAIKNFLMDGRRIVGVGNIYANESLFRAGINPRKPARRLTAEQCEKLAKAIKDTLRAAIRAGGSSLRDFVGADGAAGYFQSRYWVYGRAGQKCRRCRARIHHMQQGQRSTYYCPTCQK